MPRQSFKGKFQAVSLRAADKIQPWLRLIKRSCFRAPVFKTKKAISFLICRQTNRGFHWQKEHAAAQACTAVGFKPYLSDAYRRI